MGVQAPILLKKDCPVLYIVGAQAPILLKRDSPILYILGAQAPIFFGDKHFFHFRFQISIWQSLCIYIVFCFVCLFFFLLEQRPTSASKGQRCICVNVCVRIFFSLARIFGECSTIRSSPALLFFFKVKTLFMPESVYSGSASLDDCGRIFPDKLHVSSILDMIPHHTWTAAQLAHSDFVGSRVCACLG